MYLEIDEDFPSHPKSVRLCASLQDQVGWAYMVRLWAWAVKYEELGDLSAYEPAEIEFAVGWTRGEGKFYAAAVRAGFIDETKDATGAVTAKTLHDWMDWSGGSIARAKERAKSSQDRTARWRERTRDAYVTRTERASDSDVTPANAAEADQGQARLDQTRQGGLPRAPAPVADPGPKDPDRPPRDFNAPRTSQGLLALFGHLWGEAKDSVWYGKPQASTFATKFMDRPPQELAALAPLIRPAIEAYLATDKPFYRERKHSFDVFVRDFDSFVPAARAPPPDATDPRYQNKPLPAWTPNPHRRAALEG